MNERVHGDMLHIYLNDHLALAKGAEELAERSRGSNHGTDLGRFLGMLAGGFRDDQEAIRELLKAGGWLENPVKEVVAWLLEKVGRLKLNDRVIGYSDLSRVEELQALLLALQAMEAFWRCLGASVAEAVSISGTLITDRGEWASEKRQEAACHHVEAARKAFLRTDGGP